jgi:type II secretory pathway component PulF
MSSDRRRTIARWIVLAVVLFEAVPIALIISVIVPKFMPIFQSLGPEPQLPALTRGLLWFGQYPWASAALLLGASVGIVMNRRTDRWMGQDLLGHTLAATGLAIVLGIALLGMIVVALFLPIFTISQQVQPTK